MQNSGYPLQGTVFVGCADDVVEVPVALAKCVPLALELVYVPPTSNVWVALVVVAFEESVELVRLETALLRSVGRL